MEQTTMKPEEQLGAILAKDFAGRSSGGFRPCAMFQERLDAIRVLVRDCGVTATRVNEVITVLEDTHYRPGMGVERYVGFMIKGVHHFCETNGIDTAGPVKIAQILDAVLKSFPAQRDVEYVIDGIARRFVKETEITLTGSNVVPVMKEAA